MLDIDPKTVICGRLLMTIMEVSMSEQTKKVEMRPVKTIRQGAIAASIWKRQAPSGFEYFDFSLSRSWKTKNTGKEGYSNNFFSDNGEQLAEVIKETAEWIAAQQASLLAGMSDLPVSSL
jgi:hypothetical protein